MFLMLYSQQGKNSLVPFLMTEWIYFFVVLADV
jgi:hypothetical protein